jgi:DNA-binding response OmpR family regulator
VPKILIVDDCPDVCDFITLLLRLREFEVQTVSYKADIFKQLNSFTPDLVLLNVMLQEDCGREICKELKEQHKDISVVLMSVNSASLFDHEACLADGIIETPFNDQDIIDKIAGVLARKAKSSDAAGNNLYLASTTSNG